MDNPNADSTKRKRPVKRIIVLSIFVILTLAAYFLYNNYNRLLSEALLRSFNSNIASDVYELKFEKLRVDFLEGSIRVYNVTLLPREKPLHDYPYINSSFRLKAEKLTLINVQILELLESSTLNVQSISINKPDIEAVLNGYNNNYLPFKDSAKVVSAAGESTKKAIDSYALKEFQLVDASFHITNLGKEREFKISKFSISLDKLLIRQLAGEDLISFKMVNLSLGEFDGRLEKGAIQQISFKDYKVRIDSLQIRKTKDTLVFHFNDFKTGLNDLDVQTADSVFHLTVQSFDIFYKEKTIKLTNLSFKPNISDADLQRKFTYQHTQVAATIGTVNLVDVNFDSLIHYRKIFIDEVDLDKVEASIFKDNTKPVDKNRVPIYFGQQVKAIPLPLRVKQVNITNVNLTNTELKRDSSYAKVTIQRGTVAVKNITNLSTLQPLTVNASAYIENKVHFNVNLGFSYSQPQFTIQGKLEKFNLPDINPVIQAYTPAKISAGIADEISFSGTVYQTNSTGTMKFLFHDLAVDLALQKKAKWKSSIIAFAANTYLDSSNPSSKDSPPKIVQFRANRDMNKGFINIIIKSILSGLKETMVMNKENRKAYKDAKKKLKQQNPQ